MSPEPLAGVYTLEAPKTERSKRSIAISQEHPALLKEHRKRQIEEILVAGEKYTRQEFIFATPDGHHATLLLRAGVNPKVVSERLGHASIVITLDTYSHVLPDMRNDAVDRLQAVLRSAK